MMMTNLTKKPEQLIWTKSYRSHWYAFNVVAHPFSIENWQTNSSIKEGSYHLYFGNDLVAEFTSLEEAKDYANSIEQNLEVA
jgi:hypothetical protein